MIEALVLPKSNYASLSECVYELIAISHPQDGEAMVSLLKGRGRLWRVHDSPEWIRAVHKEKAAIYEAAIKIEAEIEEMLLKCLRAGCVHGRGSDRQGTRCDIDEEDWSKCHINIEKNALFAPMELSKYRSLLNVQVRLQDVFEELDIVKPATPARLMPTMMTHHYQSRSSHRVHRHTSDRRKKRRTTNLSI